MPREGNSRPAGRKVTDQTNHRKNNTPLNNHLICLCHILTEYRPNWFLINSCLINCSVHHSLSEHCLSSTGPSLRSKETLLVQQSCFCLLRARSFAPIVIWGGAPTPLGTPVYMGEGLPHASLYIYRFLNQTPINSPMNGEARGRQKMWGGVGWTEAFPT